MFVLNSKREVLQTMSNEQTGSYQVQKTTEKGIKIVLIELLAFKSGYLI